MQFHEFYKSVYAIMRIENGNGRLVGTASVISAKPVQCTIQSPNAPIKELTSIFATPARLGSM